MLSAKTKATRAGSSVSTLLNSSLRLGVRKEPLEKKGLWSMRSGLEPKGGEKQNQESGKFYDRFSELRKKYEEQDAIKKEEPKGKYWRLSADKNRLGSRLKKG